MWRTSRSSIVNIEMNSLNAMILISSFSAFVESMLVSSFRHTILKGKSPLAMVHVKVIRSPFWILDVRREKGAILGATIYHNVTIWNKSTIIKVIIKKRIWISTIYTCQFSIFLAFRLTLSFDIKNGYKYPCNHPSFSNIIFWHAST